MTGQEPRRAGLAQVAKAVAWSFIGIRKKSEYDRDAVTLTPLQVVIAGIVGGLIFVLTLVGIVMWVVPG